MSRDSEGEILFELHEDDPLPTAEEVNRTDNREMDVGFRRIHGDHLRLKHG